MYHLTSISSNWSYFYHFLPVPLVTCYVSSHLANLRESQNPLVSDVQDLLSGSSLVNITQCHMDIRKFSRNYAFSRYDGECWIYSFLLRVLKWCTMHAVHLCTIVPQGTELCAATMCPPEVKSYRVIWCVVQREHIVENHCDLLCFKCFQSM